MVATRNDKKISELFSIFHDGTISAWCIRDDVMELEIDIDYLAQGVSTSYSKFHMIIRNVQILVLVPGRAILIYPRH